MTIKVKEMYSHHVIVVLLEVLNHCFGTANQLARVLVKEVRVK